MKKLILTALLFFGSQIYSFDGGADARRDNDDEQNEEYQNLNNSWVDRYNFSPFALRSQNHRC